MRKVALVRNGHTSIKRIIISQQHDGVYLFPCGTLEDGSSIGDEWYESVAAAQEACSRSYGIQAADWREIADPLEGCQHDWIAPVRIKGRAEGKPLWGQLERLENGNWVDIPKVPLGQSESDDTQPPT